MEYRIKEITTGLYVSLENNSFLLSSKEKAKLFSSKTTERFNCYCNILTQLKSGVWTSNIGFFPTNETDLYKNIASGVLHFKLSTPPVMNKNIIKKYGSLDYYILTKSNKSWVKGLEFVIEENASKSIDCWIARDSNNSISLYSDMPVFNDDIGMYKSVLGFLMLPDDSFPDITFESGPKKVTIQIKGES